VVQILDKQQPKQEVTQSKKKKRIRTIMRMQHPGLPDQRISIQEPAVATASQKDTANTGHTGDLAVRSRAAFSFSSRSGLQKHF
jgi:hypothetical protein